MAYAVIGLVVLFVGLLVAAIVTVMRLRDRVAAALADATKAGALLRDTQRQYASVVSENMHLRSALKELQREVEQMEQEATDAGNRDAAGVAQRLRSRLSETGV